ncbi:MAG: hypothetical protein ACAI44_30990 [Candidatus Sericytochromatia bacterium]
MATRTVFSRLLLTGLLAFSLVQPVFAEDFISGHYAGFAAELTRSYEAIESADFQAASAAGLKARAAYKAFREDAVKKGEASTQAVQDATVAMRVDLIRLMVTLGQGFHDHKDYAKALEAYGYALEADPELPLLHYEMGFTYSVQQRKAEAARSLYEAKRLNRFPALRWLINPLDEEFRIGSDPAQLDTFADEHLVALGQSPDYPITLDFATGRQKLAVMVPGIGASLRNASGENFNLYLHDPRTTVLKQLGISQQTRKDEYAGGQIIEYLAYHDTLFTIGIDTQPAHVYSIQADEPGFSVQVQGQYIAVGEPAAKVMQLLGKDHGLERREVNQGHISHTLVYTDLGLVFGIDKSDHIALVKIWSLE